MKRISRSSLLAGAVWLASISGSQCSAQSSPVSVTVHVTNAKKAVLRNATVAVAPGLHEPFSFYRSDARGNVTVALPPGNHDLRVEVRGYPVTYERVEVAGAATIDVVLGHGTASHPARVVAGEPAPAAVPTKTAAGHGIAAPPSSTASADPLNAWSSCYFPDGLQILSAEPLPAGQTSRQVETAAGSQTIGLVAGEQVLLAWPFTDYFANVRVEELPADRYSAGKATLLANLAWLESQPGGPQDAQSLPSSLHGFEVHGNNRDQLEGAVLGMYLIFDDAAHTAATVSFLNQESWRRKFQTMTDYARLRDQFLVAYTGCVRRNQAIGQ